MTAEGDGRRSGGLSCRRWRPYDSWGCRRWRRSCRVGDLRSSVTLWTLHISRPIYMCVCDCIVQFYLQMYSMYIYRINDFWFWFWFWPQTPQCIRQISDTLRSVTKWCIMEFIHCGICLKPCRICGLLTNKTAMAKVGFDCCNLDKIILMVVHLYCTFLHVNTSFCGVICARN